MLCFILFNWIFSNSRNSSPKPIALRLLLQDIKSSSNVIKIKFRFYSDASFSVESNNKLIHFSATRQPSLRRLSANGIQTANN